MSNKSFDDNERSEYSQTTLTDVAFGLRHVFSKSAEALETEVIEVRRRESRLQLNCFESAFFKQALADNLEETYTKLLSWNEN